MHKSPVLDRAVTNCGVSVKPHPSYQNVTQVLYVKGGNVVRAPPMQPVEVQAVAIAQPM